MEKDDDTWQHRLGAMLTPAASSAPAETLARSLHAWRRLATHLSPLIGEAGFCSLYSRSLRLAGLDEAWASGATGLRTIASLLGSLEQHLAMLDAATATAASTTLLAAFTKLLAGLIGDALTVRLLTKAWADAPDRKST